MHEARSPAKQPQKTAPVEELLGNPDSRALRSGGAVKTDSRDSSPPFSSPAPGGVHQGTTVAGAREGSWWFQLDGRRRDSVEEEAGPAEREPLQRRLRRAWWGGGRRWCGALEANVGGQCGVAAALQLLTAAAGPSPATRRPCSSSRRPPRIDFPDRRMEPPWTAGGDGARTGGSRGVGRRAAGGRRGGGRRAGGGATGG
jgi:hypothetical protein